MEGSRPTAEVLGTSWTRAGEIPRRGVRAAARTVAIQGLRHTLPARTHPGARREDDLRLLELRGRSAWLGREPEGDLRQLDRFGEEGGSRGESRGRGEQRRGSRVARS